MSCGNLFATYISLTFLIKRPKSQIMKNPTKNVIWLSLSVLKSPTVCAKLHYTDKTLLILIARWDWSHKNNLCTLKWSAFQSRHVTWQPQPWASPKKWWRDYGNASQKGSWVHRSFWFHAKELGMGGVLVVSSWKSHPRYWKKCLGITYFCYDLKRTKEVVESIHVSLVVSVQCGEGERGWRGWTGWDHGIVVLRQRGGGMGVRASTVALQERGCHNDGDQKGGEDAWVQWDTRSSSGSGVGRTAVGVCGHGGSVGVGGGVSPRCGVCVVLGNHLLEGRMKRMEGWGTFNTYQKILLVLFCCVLFFEFTHQMRK